MKQLTEQIHYFYRNFIHLLFDGIFVWMITLLSPEAWIQKTFLIIALLFALYYEALSFTYQRILYHTNITVNLDLANRLIAKLVHWDFAKGFTKRLTLLSIILYHSMHHNEQVIETIEKHPRIFKGELNQYQISLTFQFFAHIELHQRSLANSLYPKLKEFEKLKAEKKKIEKIFQFKEIEGYYHLNNKRYHQALTCFQQVNTNLMNPREQIHLLQALYTTHLQLKQVKPAQARLEEIKQLSPYYEVRL